MARKYSIIDADAHVTPPPDFWASYLPAQYRERAPRLEQGDEVDYVVFEGRRTPYETMSNRAGLDERTPQVGRRAATRPGAWDPAARCGDMDIDGVDAAVIFGGGPLVTDDFDMHVASFPAYNRWLADFC